MKNYIIKYAQLNESTESIESDSLIEKLIKSAIDSIFLHTNNSIILLDYDIPNDAIVDDIRHNDDKDPNRTFEWSIELECLYVGDPSLDEELEKYSAHHFELGIDIETSYTLSGEDDYDYIDEKNQIVGIWFNTADKSLNKTYFPDIEDGQFDHLIESGIFQVIEDSDTWALTRSITEKNTSIRKIIAPSSKYN